MSQGAQGQSDDAADLVKDGLPLTMHRPVTRYQAGRVLVATDTIAAEYALTIHVNDQEMATVVCTPDHMDELVVGFLASEGVIRSIDQLTDLHISRYRGVARATTSTAQNFNQAFFNKRYIASCCGKSRQSFYFVNDAHTAKRVEDAEWRLQPEQVLHLVRAMETSSPLFRSTGGVHTASLCDGSGVIVSRSDIGRHNALDKLYGHCLREKVEESDKIVAFSGRLSSEVLLKVAKMGVGMVLAKSAPTALAIDMAEELNMTAVGFVRGDHFNVYTHPWRIEWDDSVSNSE